MSKKTDKKQQPWRDAFLTNPVASASEFTGYGVKLPLSEEEADSLSDMMEDVPTTPSRMGDAAKDIKKNRNTVK